MGEPLLLMMRFLLRAWALATAAVTTRIAAPEIVDDVGQETQLQLRPDADFTHTAGFAPIRRLSHRPPAVGAGEPEASLLGTRIYRGGSGRSISGSTSASSPIRRRVSLQCRERRDSRPRQQQMGRYYVEVLNFAAGHRLELRAELFNARNQPSSAIGRHAGGAGLARARIERATPRRFEFTSAFCLAFACWVAASC